MTISVIEEIARNLMKAIGKQKMTEKEILLRESFKINPAELIKQK